MGRLPHSFIYHRWKEYKSRRRIFEEKGTLDRIQEKGSLIPYDLIINERNLKLFLLWGHDKGKANEGGHRHS